MRGHRRQNDCIGPEPKMWKLLRTTNLVEQRNLCFQNQGRQAVKDWTSGTKQLEITTKLTGERSEVGVLLSETNLQDNYNSALGLLNSLEGRIQKDPNLISCIKNQYMETRKRDSRKDVQTQSQNHVQERIKFPTSSSDKLEQTWFSTTCFQRRVKKQSIMHEIQATSRTWSTTWNDWNNIQISRRTDFLPADKE